MMSQVRRQRYKTGEEIRLGDKIRYAGGCGFITSVIYGRDHSSANQNGEGSDHAIALTITTDEHPLVFIDQAEADLEFLGRGYPTTQPSTATGKNGNLFPYLVSDRMAVFGEPLDTRIRKLRNFMSYERLYDWFQPYWTIPPDQLQPVIAAKLAELRRHAKAENAAKREQRAAIRELVLIAAARERQVAEFNLFGRGHEPRVTLDRQLAAILRGLDLPRMPISLNTYYPARVFTRAVTLLKRRLKQRPIALYMYNGGRSGRVCMRYRLDFSAGRLTRTT
jgi:hypothetical protein